MEGSRWGTARNSFSWRKCVPNRPKKCKRPKDDGTLRSINFYLLKIFGSADRPVQIVLLKSLRLNLIFTLDTLNYHPQSALRTYCMEKLLKIYLPILLFSTVRKVKA